MNVYHVKQCPIYVKNIVKKYYSKINDSSKRTIFEEAVGNVSANSVVAIFSFTAGGLALLADPISGTIIIGSSIIYGSVMKISSGNFFQSKVLKKPPVLNIDTENLEENIMKILEQITNSPKNIVIKGGRFKFMRIFSRSDTSPLSKINGSPKIMPLPPPPIDEGPVDFELS